MKNLLKILGVIMLTAVVSCDNDPIVFDNVNGPTAVSFRQTAIQTSVPQEDQVVTIPTQVTTVSDQDRTFNVSVVEADDTSAFILGDVVIPAGSYEGVFEFTIDFSEIGGDDGDLRTATLQLTPAGDASAYFDILEVQYFREIICNDATLTIVTDFWASETGFTLTDSNGNVLYSLAEGSLSDGEQVITQDITLPDGCYTATITDFFNDGQVSDGSFGSTVATGSWSIDCSILTFASGGGAFGASETVNFCVNQ